MNLSRTLADFAATVSLSDIPASVIAATKDRILDSIGNIFAGKKADGNAAAFHVYGAAASGTASVFGSHDLTSAENAAFLNGLMQRSWDFETCAVADSDGKLYPAHVSGSTFPATFAAAETVGASGADLLLAQIIADDIAARVTVASGFHLEVGTDNTGISNGFGCVAAAARLNRATPEVMVNAFGIILNQLAGTIENIFDGAHAFKLPQALSAKNAIAAVELAQAGFTGPTDPLGGRYGFFSLFGEGVPAESLCEGLGKRFSADRIIKPWSCCRLLHGPVEATIRLRRDEDVTQVAAVRITAPQAILKGFTAVPFVPGESTPTAALFNLRLCVVLALIYGDVRPELMNDVTFTDPLVVQLLSRTTLHAAVSSYDTEQRMITVEIERSDHTIRSEAIGAALGDTQLHPMTHEQLVEKFEKNMQFGGVSMKTTAEIRHLVYSLDSAADIQALSTLVRTQTPHE